MVGLLGCLWFMLFRCSFCLSCSCLDACVCFTHTHTPADYRTGCGIAEGVEEQRREIKKKESAGARRTHVRGVHERAYSFLHQSRQWTVPTQNHTLSHDTQNSATHSACARVCVCVCVCVYVCMCECAVESIPQHNHNIHQHTINPKKKVESTAPSHHHIMMMTRTTWQTTKQEREREREKGRERQTDRLAGFKRCNKHTRTSHRYAYTGSYRIKPHTHIHYPAHPPSPHPSRQPIHNRTYRWFHIAM